MGRIIEPTFKSDSRLMMIAPHPDDESLACSVILQRAVGAGASICIVYATDGDDNPWPQRLWDRKWRLNAADRKRWGKLRREEALAALRVLGVEAARARFLALPDQKLTALLRRNCESIIESFVELITGWVPTDVLVPSLSDTHPDHNALGVMLRLTWAKLSPPQVPAFLWSYAVHGRSPAFFHRAQSVLATEMEKAVKLQAIRCHKTQLKLSRRRFLKYALRPETLLNLEVREATAFDGSIQSLSRERAALNLGLKFRVKGVRLAEPTVSILGHNAIGTLQCVNISLPARSSQPGMLDCATGRRIGLARYGGNGFSGELTVPLDKFSAEHPLFVKVERRRWFFDEAGWVEVPGAARLDRTGDQNPIIVAPCVSRAR
jgi:LmbE family N-acetylglucosaminyl deacetylase